MHWFDTEKVQPPVGMAVLVWPKEFCEDSPPVPAIWGHDNEYGMTWIFPMGSARHPGSFLWAVPPAHPNARRANYECGACGAVYGGRSCPCGGEALYREVMCEHDKYESWDTTVWGQRKALRGGWRVFAENARRRGRNKNK